MHNNYVLKCFSEEHIRIWDVVIWNKNTFEYYMLIALFIKQNMTTFSKKFWQLVLGMHYILPNGSKYNYQGSVLLKSWTLKCIYLGHPRAQQTTNILY